MGTEDLSGNVTTMTNLAGNDYLLAFKLVKMFAKRINLQVDGPGDGSASILCIGAHVNKYAAIRQFVLQLMPLDGWRDAIWGVVANVTHVVDRVLGAAVLRRVAELKFCQSVL